MKRNRRIGVIGVGFGLQVHVPGFRSEGWDVVALCSRDAQRARQAADAVGVFDVHTDASELIGRRDLDAVSIATPPAPHRDLAIAALRAGKHVLCEKPFAVNAAQAAEMRDVAEKSGLTAMVAHEFRHTPQRAYIKELLSGGYIGQFNLCTMELYMDRGGSPSPAPGPWGSQSSQGGGFLGALGSHYIDGLRNWFGEVATASGQVWRHRPDLLDQENGKPARSDTDDSFTFVLTFKSGGVATMSASSAAPQNRGARVQVLGSDGALFAEQPGPNPLENGIVYAARKGQQPQPLETPAKFVQFSDKRDPRLVAFRLLVRDFTRGIEEGTSPSPNFSDGLRCQQVLDAVRESSKTGRTIPLH